MTLLIGSALYLLGIAFMFGGLQSWAWLPISWGAFAFGWEQGRLIGGIDEDVRTSSFRLRMFRCRFCR